MDIADLRRVLNASMARTRAILRKRERRLNHGNNSGNRKGKKKVAKRSEAVVENDRRGTGEAGAGTDTANE